MGGTGLEHTANSSGTARICQKRGTESGTVANTIASVIDADPDLQKLVAAWSELPHLIKNGILALINASKMSTNKGALAGQNVRGDGTNELT